MRKKKPDAYSYPSGFLLSLSGSKSQNQKESLKTLSPTENLTSSLKDGPAKTKEWNSPFSPHGSTYAGSDARKSSSISINHSATSCRSPASLYEMRAIAAQSDSPNP
jgi:hypothetical protein